MIELRPATTSAFDATYPHDINDLGQVVGKSFNGSGPYGPGAPYSTATLWENGSPFALTASPNQSEALKINNRGEILYVQYDKPAYGKITTYFVWRNGAALDLKTVVPGLISAIDLNNNGLVLGLQDAGVFVYNLRTGKLDLLPPLIVNGNALALNPLGIDDVGRVVVIPNRVVFTGENIQDIYWLAKIKVGKIETTMWINAEIKRSDGFFPTVTKSGRLLTAIAGVNAGLGCYLDLNNPTSGVKYIPHVPPPADPASLFIPISDDTQGRIVCNELLGSSPPVLYNSSTGEFSQLRLDPGWVAHPAIGANESGMIIGYGTKNSRSPAAVHRGWVAAWPLSLDQVAPALAVLVLLGAIPQDGGGTGINYGGVPVPVGPWGPLSMALAVDELGARLGSGPGVHQLTASVPPPGW